MAPTLTIDGYDISSYVAWGERSADITDPTRLAPQFGGNTALADGQPWVRTSAADKTWQIPLLLNAASTDTLHTLVQTINSHLFQGAQVAFKPQGATNTTYFDLEAGRLDEHWDLYIDTAGFLQATLNLWTRPYGHTGTTRLVASWRASYYVQVAATGILGDIDARAAIYGAASPVARDFAMWAVAKSASYMFVHPAASLIVTGASLLGASGAIGSQAWDIYALAQPSGVTSNLAGDTFNPVAAYTGRNRVLAVLRCRATPVDAYRLANLNGSSLTSDVTPSSIATGNYGLLDFGEVNVPGPASGLALATYGVLLQSVGRGGTVTPSGPHTKLNTLIYLPLDTSAGMVVADNIYSVANELNGSQVVADAIRGAVYGGNATVFETDLSRQFRGNLPALPVTGSPVASAAQFFYMSGKRTDVSNTVGGSIPAVEVQVYARERFTYLR